MAFKQKSIYVLVVAVFMMAVWAGVRELPARAGSNHWTDGSNANIAWYDPTYSTYTIDTPAKLAGVAKLVNDGVSSGGATIDGFSGKILEIDRDLDMSAFLWVPIGTAAKPFKGTLIAAGGVVKNVSGVTVNDDVTYGGFIGFMDGATVGGFKFTSTGSVHVPSVTQAVYVGAVVGKMVNNSTLYDITNEMAVTAATVTGVTYAGGIAGESEGVVSNTANYGAVTASGGQVYAGGIAANISGNGLKLKKIWNYGGVSATSQVSMAVYAGGIAGVSSLSVNMKEEDTTIANSGTVTATNGSVNYAGGIVGKVGGIASFSANTSNSGAINVSASSASGSYAGGLAGYAVTSQIGRSLNFSYTGTGAVTNNGGSNVYTGSLIGYVAGDLTWGSSVTNGAAVTASGNDHVYSGGLLGYVSGEAVLTNAAKNTSTVKVTGAAANKPDETYTGGLIGYVTGRVLLDGTADGAYLNSGAVTVQGGTGVYTGGIVSNRAYARTNGQTANNVASTGNITVSGVKKLYTGGFVGWLPADSADKTIAQASYSGMITVTAQAADTGNAISTGGIVGYSLGGTLDDNAFAGSIHSSGGGAETYSGGIAGFMDGGAMHRSKIGGTAAAMASISADSVVGGAAGYLRGTLDTATVQYIAETVRTADGVVGGVAGLAQGAIAGATVGDSAATDSASATMAAADGIDRLTAGGIVGRNDGALTVTGSQVTQIGLLSKSGRSGYHLGAVAGTLSDDAQIGADGAPVAVKQLVIDVRADNSEVGGAIGTNHATRVYAKVEHVSLIVAANGVKAGGVAGIQDVSTATAGEGRFALEGDNISVSAQGSGALIGGLIGEFTGSTATGLSASLTVTASGADNRIGGIAGRNTGTISGAQVKLLHVEASGERAQVGGAVGRSEGLASPAMSIIADSSVQSGDAELITATGANAAVGGVVGYAVNTEVSHSQISYDSSAETPGYAIISAAGANTSAGGVAGSILTGKITGDTLKTNVDNLILSGTSTADTSYFGGIAGYSDQTRVEGIDSGAVNLIVDSPNARVGGLTGYNLGTDTAILINNHTDALSIKINEHAVASTVGGMIGLNDLRSGDPVADPDKAISSIQNSRIVGSIQVGANSVTTGGMVGENRSLIANGSITDKISVAYANTADNGIVGGLVGLNVENGILYYTYSNVNLTIGGKNTLAGGLVGDNKGKMTASYVDIDIAGDAYGDDTEYAYLGGLVGRNIGTIAKSYSVSKVTSNGSYTIVGGLVGDHEAGSITDSYAAKEVAANGDHSYAGGLLGRITGGTVTTAYSAGRISAVDGSYAGGFAGRYDNEDKQLLSKTFYVKDVDNDINGDLPDFADGNYIWLNIYPRLSTILASSLQDRDYFPSLSGWDFNTTWRYGSKDAAYRYPELIRTANSGGEAGSGDEVNASVSWYVRDPGAPTFELKSEADLAGLAAIVNGTVPGVDKFDFAGRTVKVIHPIHVQTQQWIPIGVDDSSPFQGVFDGNRQLIDGYSLSPGYSNAGLFGVLGSQSRVVNAWLEPLSIEGGQFTGALAGINQGTVSHAEIKLLNGIRIAAPVVGGAIGKNSGTLTGLSLSMDGGSRIEALGTGGIAGGMIGDSVAGVTSGALTFSSADGKIFSTADGATVGGIVGRQTGDFSDFNGFYAVKLQVSATGSNVMEGGVIGQQTTGKATRITVDFSGVTMEAPGSGAIVGGLIGSSPAANPIDHITLTAAQGGWRLTANGIAGGIVGVKQGQGSNTYDLDEVKVENLSLNSIDGAGQAVLGGVAGKLTDTAVRKAASGGTIQAAGPSAVAGGIAGQVDDSLLYSVDVQMNIYASSQTGEAVAGGVAGLLTSSDIGKSLDFGKRIPFYMGIYQASVSSGQINVTTTNQAMDLFVGGIAGKNKAASIYMAQSVVTISSNGGRTAAVGGIAGYSDGILVHTVSHSGIAADASSLYDVGGIVGQAFGGEIHYASASAVSGEKIVVGSAITQPGLTITTRVGGFVGNAERAAITDSYTDIPVQVDCDNPDNTIYAGGFAGVLGQEGTGTGTLKRAYAKGALTVRGITGSYVGGFVGYVDRYTIDGAYAAGDVDNTGFDTQSGGFVGVVERSAKISGAYAVSGKVAATGVNHAVRAYAGGFAGYNDGAIDGAYASVPVLTVNAEGANVFSGDFIGYNFRNGAVSQSSSYVARDSAPVLIGRNLGTADVSAADSDKAASYGYGNWNFDIDPAFLYDAESPSIVIMNAKQLNAAVRLYNDIGLDYYKLFNRTAAAKPDIHQFALGADIVMDNHPWIPFALFSGEFDGQGKSIQGLASAYGVKSAYGFVGENSGKIFNITFTDAHFAASDNSGIVAGINRVGATIDGITVTGSTVQGGQYTGGIAGNNQGTVSNAQLQSLTVKGTGYVGGLAGGNEGAVSGAQAQSLTVNGADYTGGLAGANSGTIANVTVKETAVAGTGGYAGGVAGDNRFVADGSGHIDQAALTGVSVSAVGGNTGLAAGFSHVGASISGMTADGGKVQGGDNTGGAAGTNEGTLSNVQLQSLTVDGAAYTGGLAGKNSGSIDQAVITDAVVTGSGGYTGGLVGENGSDSGDNGKMTQTTLTRVQVAAADHVGLAAGINRAGAVIRGLTADGGKVQGGDNTGGAAGINEGALSAVKLNTLTVDGVGYVGGLAGVNSGTIDQIAVNEATVTGSGSYVGGIAGDNRFIAEGSGKITQAALTGVKVTAVGDNAGLAAGANEVGASISGLTADGSSVQGGDYTGGAVGINDGSLTDVKLHSLAVSGADYSGGVAGATSGTIDQIAVNDATVTGSGSFVGGIAGENRFVAEGSGKITQAALNGVKVTATGDHAGLGAGVNQAGASIGGVTADDSSVQGGNNIGGAAGTNEGVLTDVQLKSLEVSGADFIGGLAGTNSGDIDQAAVDGTIHGTGEFAGGAVGVNEGKVSKTYSSGSILDTNSASVMKRGGIAGWNKTDGKIEESFSYMDLKIVADQAAVGGIAGINEGTIESIYYSGRAEADGASASWAGGIAGHAIAGTILGAMNYGEIVASVNGTIVPGQSYFGGIAGQRDAAGTVANAAYNKQMLKDDTAYYDAAGKKVTGISDDATGMTAKQLINGSLPAGWDSSVWLAVPGFCPQLSAFVGTDAAKLSTVAIIFSDKDTINRVRSGFGLSSEEQVVWTADPGEIAIGNDASSPDGLSGSVQKEGSVAIAVTVNEGARRFTLNTPALKYAETAATPTADPGIYVFMGDVSVTLATEEPNASIYYTVDGSNPDLWSSLYTGPIKLTDTTTILAIAVVDDKEFSEPFSGTWMKRPPTYGGVGAVAVTDPGIVAQVGTNKMQTGGKSAVPIAKNSELTLTPPAGQTIYYTTDGSTPTKDSPKYTGSILITGDMIVKVITDQNDKVVTINYQVENAKYELKSDAGKIKYISGYPNQEFRPDSPLSRYEAVDVLEPLLDLEDVTVGNTFADVGNKQANSVALLTSAGIIDGYPDHSFGGDKGLTRAEFVVIMARVLKLPVADAGESEFADVQDHWSVQYIDAFAKAGYVEGFPDGTFKPDDEITRAEAVVLINRVIGGGQPQEQAGDDASFTDLPPSHWAYQDIMAAAK